MEMRLTDTDVVLLDGETQVRICVIALVHCTQFKALVKQKLKMTKSGNR